MLSLVDVLMCDVLHEQNLRCVLRDLVTENADLQSRVVELQSRHQVKGSVLVYEFPFIFVARVMVPPIRLGAWSMAL